MNGTTRNSNNVRIDSALANNIWLPHVTAYVPARDSIEAVRVVTASADASEGMAGGSAVNVQIKSGTNQIHGSLFEFHADNRMKAKPFFLHTGQGKPKYIDNQFGGSIGGSIIKDKLFYFGSWEGTYNRRTGSSFVTVLEHGVECGRLYQKSWGIHGHRGTSGVGREGIDERMFRLGVRITFLIAPHKIATRACRLHKTHHPAAAQVYNIHMQWRYRIYHESAKFPYVFVWNQPIKVSR